MAPQFQTFVSLFIFLSLTLSSHAQILIPFKIDQNSRHIYTQTSFTLGSCVLSDTELLFFKDCYNNYNQQLLSNCSCGGTQIAGLTCVNTFSSNNFQIIANYMQIQTYQQYTMRLCLGSYADSSNQNQNLVKQLYDQGVISQPIVYMGLLSNSSQISGEINIGEPNQQFIKNGSSLVKILYKKGLNDYFWTLQSNGEVTFFGQKMSGSSNYFINFLDEVKSQKSNITTVDKNFFEQMIKILEERNYKIVKQQSYDQFNYYLYTIQGLEPIYITLLAEDNSPYIIKINPSLYTKEIIQGFYQLTIQTTNQNDRVWQLSIDILNSYYMGQDTKTKNVFIAERADDLNRQQVSQNEENITLYLRTQNI